MTALNLDRAVVTKRGACRPIPKNGLPYSAPNDVDFVEPLIVDAANYVYTVSESNVEAPKEVEAKSISSISAPNTLSGTAYPLIELPNEVSSVGGAVILTPRVTGNVSPNVIASPNDVNAKSAETISSPNNVSNVLANEIDAPNNISGIDGSDIESPNFVGNVTSSEVSSPNNVSGVDSNDIDAPNVIGQKAYSYAPPFPLSHPRILYETVTTGASISATSGTNPAYALTPNTWERWIFSGSQSITITFNEDKLIDSVGIGSAQLSGKTVLVEYSETVGGAFLPMQTQTGKDGAMLFLTDGYTGHQGYTARRVRITATGAGTGSIGVIYAGVALQLQQAVYGGVSPIPLSRVTQYSNSRTESGEWIGRSVKSMGLKGQIKLDKVFEDWYREYFDPFVEAAIYKPFFYSWRPDKFPSEAAYCWTTGDISPSNNGGGSERVSVSFTVEANS